MKNFASHMTEWVMIRLVGIGAVSLVLMAMYLSFCFSYTLV